MPNLEEPFNASVFGTNIWAEWEAANTIPAIDHLSKGI